MNSEPAKKHSWRGVKLCAGIVLVGGAFLLGLYALGPPPSPRVPAGVMPGVPDTPMHVVSMDAKDKSIDDVLARLKPLSPDVVMLQRVEARNVPALVGAMDMAQSHHAANYQPTQNLAGKKSPYGTLLLSRHRIYQARPLRASSGSFGVMGECVVNNRQFTIASVDFSTDPTIRSAEENALKQTLAADGPSFIASRERIEQSGHWSNKNDLLATLLRD